MKTAFILLILFLIGCQPFLDPITDKPRKGEYPNEEEIFAMEGPTEKGLDVEYAELKQKTTLLREESHFYWVAGKRYSFSREYRLNVKTDTEFLVNKVGNTILSIQPMRETKIFNWDLY